MSNIRDALAVGAGISLFTTIMTVVFAPFVALVLWTVNYSEWAFLALGIVIPPFGWVYGLICLFRWAWS